MQTPDRLTLTLRRIEEFLVILRVDDFGDDAEGGRRVIDDLRFLHGQLKAGRKRLPLPADERRPLNVAYGHDGHFADQFSELHDRTVDLLNLFDAVKWPLISWQSEPLGGSVPQEDELRILYGTLRQALIDRRLGDLMTPLERALKATSLALGEDEDFEFLGERDFIEELMQRPDYRSDAPPPDLPIIRPMFDGNRVRLLHPQEERHALAIFPYTDLRGSFPIQCQFGRVDGHWMVVGYG